MIDAFREVKYKDQIKNDVKCAQESLFELTMTLNRIHNSCEHDNEIEQISADFLKSRKEASKVFIDLVEKRIKQVYLKQHIRNNIQTSEIKIKNPLPVQKRIDEEFNLRVYV